MPTILVVFDSSLRDLGFNDEEFQDFDEVLYAVNNGDSYHNFYVLNGTFNQCNQEALRYVAPEDFKNVNEAFESLNIGNPTAWASVINEEEYGVEQCLVFITKKD